MPQYRLWVKANAQAEALGFVHTYLELETAPTPREKPTMTLQEYVFDVVMPNMHEIARWYAMDNTPGEIAKYYPMGALLYFTELGKKAPK
jgi:hypothetical protein